MGKKTTLGFGIITLICMGGLPILINGLMFKHYFPVAGNEVTWIGSLSSIWGAIIGGVISGALTLIGVRLTIKNELNKEFQEKMPEQLMNIEDIISFIKKQNALLNRGTRPEATLRLRMKYTYEGLSEDGLLKKSTAVNLHTYSTVRKLYDFIYNSLFPNHISTFTENEVKQSYKSCLDALELEHKKIISKIEKYEVKRK